MRRSDPPRGGPAAFTGTRTDQELRERGYDLMAEYDRAVALAALPPGAPVLDIATGTGRMVHVLATAGHRVVTGDLDPEVVRLARESLGPPAREDVVFRVLDARRLDLPDDAFDAAVIADALHHMDEPADVLAEMARVLGPHGRLLVVEFNDLGFRVMDEVHRVIHGQPHPTGRVSSGDLCENLHARFERVEHHVLPLHHVWLATGRRPEPLEPGRVQHRRCFACGAANPHGLGLRFEPSGMDGVVARCTLDERFQGYAGVAQGGIVSLLLDAAMTHCLFQRGVRAMTARLSVRFRRPVRTGVPMTVTARILGGPATTRTPKRVHSLSAEIEQDGELRADATATFLDIPGMPATASPAGKG